MGDAGGGCVLLSDLPVELLAAILKHCSLESLGRLARCSRFFKDLIYADTVWRRFLARPELGLLFCSEDPSFLERRWLPSSLRHELRLSHNWRTGDAQYHVLRSSGRTKFMPWLQLTHGGRLWTSVGRRLVLLDLSATLTTPRRFGNRVPDLRPGGYGGIGKSTLGISGSHADDITRFRVDRGIVVTACRDCGIRGWNEADGSFVFERPFAHTKEVTAIDFVDGLLASGGRAQSVKLWRLDGNRLREGASVSVFDNVLSCAFSPDLTRCAVGVASLFSFRSVAMIDVATGTLMESWRHSGHIDPDVSHGDGVIGIEWLDSNVLATVGYDTTLRLIDARCGRDVQKWTDPYGSALYCLDVDRDNLIVTGCASNGIVRLWDKRRSGSHLKAMCVSTRSTPVFSLAFDPNGLYVALESSLLMVDFQHFARNYSHEGKVLATLRSVNYAPPVGRRREVRRE